VATGAVYAALGTDTAGSVRQPAAFCGVLGLKARPDALPMTGILPLAPSMDSAGCFARTPEDLALVWAVLADDENVGSGTVRPGDEGVGRPVPDGRRGLGRAVPASEDVLGGAPLRIGLPDPAPPADPEIAAAVTRAVARLGEPVRVAVPPWEAWVRPRGRTLVAEALDAHRAAGWYPARANEYSDEALASLRAAERLSAADRATAQQDLKALDQALRAALAHADVLALPVCAVPPPARDADPVRAALELAPLVGPASAAGLAAASAPCGTTAGGLPIGLQLVGADERTVLAAVLRGGGA
jgi:aspartyl-tRNA(Asn)/glutamyl-tRNA(Gln) amidotransferase subunit A